VRGRGARRSPARRRGGRGRSAASTKEEDFIEQLWLVNTHDTLLTFTSAGKVFWLPVHQLPEAGSNARGRPIINWIPLEAGERVHRAGDRHVAGVAGAVVVRVRAGAEDGGVRVEGPLRRDAGGAARRREHREAEQGAAQRVQGRQHG
jgi:hypothetical protein